MRSWTCVPHRMKATYLTQLVRMFPLILGMVALVAACSPKGLGFSYSDLPSGDPVRGAEAYTQSIGGSASCASCHPLDDSRGAGPSLQGYSAIAGQRVRGQTAEQYTFDSILRPSKHLLQGWSNIMPSDYAEKLSRQQIADLIAYLLTG